VNNGKFDLLQPDQLTGTDRQYKGSAI